MVSNFENQPLMDKAGSRKPGNIREVQLDYRDDEGRLLTPKEAFRHLSYRFHGRKPGRKNFERKIKQLQEREYVIQKGSEHEIQTSIPTLKSLHRETKKAKAPFMVLSGGI
eukprot:TRINITY_DN69_c0_g1_i1.p1 TRINITY_DN69_c0_g1~~TRINITY_DN69_c0_g1_i1.p1  ORF type:complete len:111 (-),score=14.91 TRINITY_DN69_c0_g1_i1:41-373(-)